jgi:hypothetical protein
MASLPQFQNDDKDFQMMQNRWASILNPVINNALNNGSILSAIPLATGTNVINHLLSRKLQGWSIVRINAAATIYDTQDSNPTPNQTLVLVASAPCTVSLEVF